MNLHSYSKNAWISDVFIDRIRISGPICVTDGVPKSISKAPSREVVCIEHGWFPYRIGGHCCSASCLGCADLLQHDFNILKSSTAPFVLFAAPNRRVLKALQVFPNDQHDVLPTTGTAIHPDRIDLLYDISNRISRCIMIPFSPPSMKHVHLGHQWRGSIFHKPIL